MPFTAGMRYKLASAISFSSMALTSPRWALTIISFSVNLYLRELPFGRSEEDREAYRYEDNLSVKCKFDKPYSTLQVSHAMKSTALCLAGQQLWGNTARRAGKREIHSLYTSHCPSSYSCCSSQKASGLQWDAFRLFSPSNSHFLSTQFNIWSTSISRSICTEAKLNILDSKSKIPLIVPREYSFI